MDLNFKRGLSTSNQPSVVDGQIVYHTDTSKLYIDVANQRKEVGAGGAFSIYNQVILSSNWTSSGNSMYPYKATITISELKETDIVSLKYNNMDIINYMFSPELLIENGQLTIYAVNQPTSTITIPEINCYQTV